MTLEVRTVSGWRSKESAAEEAFRAEDPALKRSKGNQRSPLAYLGYLKLAAAFYHAGGDYRRRNEICTAHDDLVFYMERGIGKVRYSEAWMGFPHEYLNLSFKKALFDPIRFSDETTP